MLQTVKRLLKAVLPDHAFDELRCRTGRNRQRGYAQEGEDLILQLMLAWRANGFYVDVGAHHPQFDSNTYLFYKRGWSGINIDAMPNSMKLFNRLRPRDINLELAISKKSEELTYYLFNTPQLNGFS